MTAARVAGAAPPPGLAPRAPVARSRPPAARRLAADERVGEPSSQPAEDPAATLAVLEALARGEIDVAEAERRLGASDRPRWLTPSATSFAWSPKAV